MPTASTTAATDAVATLRSAGLDRGGLLALATSPTTVAVAADGATWSAGLDGEDARHLVRAIDDELRPRWVWWSARDVRSVATEVSTCWDVSAVHQLIAGGQRRSPAQLWARHRGLDPDGMPVPLGGADSLFAAAERELGDPDSPVRPDGYLRPDWGRLGWAPTPVQLEAWAATALEVAAAQAADRDADRATATVARSESTAALLCLELERDGLPIDRSTAEAIIADHAGPRPSSPQDAAIARQLRDDAVLAHVPGASFDLRNPGSVKSLLRRVGIEVEDTRAWRLERMIDAHPVIPALLAWRRAERLATTYGYDWIDANVGADGRLRGRWEPSDGAAGRMTATAGLHSLPAVLRPAIAADPGHALVRSDLGQVEPRVLAVVSGDERFARASAADDLYAEVATTLGVEREVAKLAVLGAMYGQTTGRGAEALAELRRAFPVAMATLEDADEAARRGDDLATFGGRRLRLSAGGDAELDETAARSRAAARGRYGRNAIIQGAAAELFKLWAVVVRARIRPFDARIVLCLHDELLVHAPAAVAGEVSAAVDAALAEAVDRWAPDTAVRFVTDTVVVDRWSDAK